MSAPLVGSYVVGEQYFAARPGAASRPGTVDLVLPDLHLRLATDRGVFSADRVDPGTRVLLETVPPPPADGHLLDLGCGYGPIALTAAGRAAGVVAWGVDVNERALDLARRNAKTAGLDNVKFRLVTEVPPEARFDALWSNPPIRIGKAAMHDLLTTWIDRLRPGALAHLVVHRHLGADSLHRWLAGRGHPTDRIASRGGYRVLRVAARPSATEGEPA